MSLEVEPGHELCASRIVSLERRLAEAHHDADLEAKLAEAQLALTDLAAERARASLYGKERDALKGKLERAREALTELADDLQTGAHTLCRAKAVLAQDRDWLLSKAQKVRTILAALDAEKEAGG